jgi:hypothetical protein
VEYSHELFKVERMALRRSYLTFPLCDHSQDSCGLQEGTPRKCLLLKMFLAVSCDSLKSCKACLGALNPILLPCRRLLGLPRHESVSKTSLTSNTFTDARSFARTNGGLEAETEKSDNYYSHQTPGPARVCRSPQAYWSRSSIFRYCRFRIGHTPFLPR